jgi:hypothetical protein
MVGLDGYGGCHDCQRHNPKAMRWRFTQPKKSIYTLIAEAESRGGSIRQTFEGDQVSFGIQ